MEEIVFPIPEICRFLTEETKKTTFFETEMDDKDSKIADFFERSTSMYREMAWQKKLQGNFSFVFHFLTSFVPELRILSYFP